MAEKLKILFLCTINRMRSATAQVIYEAVSVRFFRFNFDAEAEAVRGGGISGEMKNIRHIVGQFRSKP